MSNLVYNAVVKLKYLWQENWPNWNVADNFFLNEYFRWDASIVAELSFEL